MWSSAIKNESSSDSERANMCERVAHVRGSETGSTLGPTLSRKVVVVTEKSQCVRRAGYSCECVCLHIIKLENAPATPSARVKSN